jgi:hypothetical protein
MRFFQIRIAQKKSPDVETTGLRYLDLISVVICAEPWAALGL